MFPNVSTSPTELREVSNPICCPSSRLSVSVSAQRSAFAIVYCALVLKPIQAFSVSLVSDATGREQVHDWVQLLDVCYSLVLACTTSYQPSQRCHTEGRGARLGTALGPVLQSCTLLAPLHPQLKSAVLKRAAAGTSDSLHGPVRRAHRLRCTAAV